MMRWIALSFKVDQPALRFEQSILPGLSPEASQSFWLQLGMLCFAHTPFVSRTVDKNRRPDGFFRQGFLLEISRCTRLFKGEQALYQRLIDGIGQLPLQACPDASASKQIAVCMAAASHGQAAWWRSLLVEPLQIESIQAQAHASGLLRQGLLGLDQIRQLPAGVLDLNARQRALLSQLGLYSLHQLDSLPRAELSQRLGPAALRELDQGFGREPAMIQEYTVPALFEAEREMPFHAKEAPLIERQMRRILDEFEVWMQGRQLRTSELLWTLHLPHKQKQLRVRSARWLQRAEDWMRLITHPLSRLELEDEVTHLKLRCDHFRPQTDHSQDLFNGSPFETEQNWLGLCDEVAGRLGRQALAHFKLESDPRPELGFRRLENAASRNPAIRQATLPPSADRPLALLEQPVPIRSPLPDWRSTKGWRLVTGPERIEFGWWDQQACKRDYYRAVNPDDVQGWIYRDHDPAAGQSCMWYLHGYFV